MKRQRKAVGSTSPKRRTARSIASKNLAPARLEKVTGGAIVLEERPATKSLAPGMTKYFTESGD